MKWKNHLLIGVVIGLCLFVFSGTSNAISLTGFEIIWQEEGGTDPDMLSGTVDVSINGSELVIILTNTSEYGASSEDSSLVLTAFGFNTGNFVVNGGSISTALGSTEINFGGADLNEEWGWANDQRGQFNPEDIGIVSTIDTIVSSMAASTETSFAGVTPTNDLDGPGFGLLSGEETGFGGGLPVIQDSVEIRLSFTTEDLSGLLDIITTGDVVLAFGSSDSPGVPVPEPATAALLGIGLVGLAGGAARRKWKKKTIEKD